MFTCNLYFKTSDLLAVYTPSRQLGSSADIWILPIPHIKMKIFNNNNVHLLCAHHRPENSHFWPVLFTKHWNSLPSDIHHFQSTHAFVTVFKTHFYEQYHK